MTGKSHTIGSRRQVWNGTAKKTSGGLLKSDLMLNKNGRIVSKSKHASAKREKRLVKAGYGTKKGSFGFVKFDSKKNRKGSKKQKGGHVNINIPNSAFLPPVNIEAGSGIDGQGITPGGPNTAALMAGGSGANGQNVMNPSTVFSEGPMGPMGAGNGIDGQGITPGGPNTAALMAGGRRRARKMKGGYAANGQNILNPSTVRSEGPMGPMGTGNGIAGQGITPGGPNTIALMAGGRRRGRKMKGGTTDYNQMATYAKSLGINVPYGPGGVTRSALNAASS
jgi:hypothetical protein